MLVNDVVKNFQLIQKLFYIIIFDEIFMNIDSITNINNITMNREILRIVI